MAPLPPTLAGIVGACVLSTELFKHRFFRS